MSNEGTERSHERHAAPVIVITLSLAVSLVIAAVTVSIGIARAEACLARSPVRAQGNPPLTLQSGLSLVFSLL
jgi:hypothetical protein